jgi:hypothetical protein
MGGPPEPFFKEFFGPPPVLIGPELSKGFFEQIGAVDSEVQLFQRSEPDFLLVGEIPGS